MTSFDAAAAAIDAVLPQTQCRRCGYADCRRYAEAIAAGEARIDRCPPGGAEGVQRLAAVTGRPPLPLDPTCGREGPRGLARIDEAACIGCTLCIAACPVDAIVGAAKWMHTVVDAACTGCELCVPACPVDCIVMRPHTGGRTGWQAWSQPEADAARGRYRQRLQRLGSAGFDAGADAAAPALTDATRRSLVEAAMQRARARRPDTPPDDDGR